VKCLILAAGYATRLYPLTENFPKPLLKVGEKTILDWLIDDINSVGAVDEYVVISNHKFVEHFSDWSKTRNEKITVIDDLTTSNENRLGAVCDIKFAIDKLSINDDMLVIAGDNVLDFSLRGFINYSIMKNASCIMRYYEPDYNKLVKCGVVEIDSDDRILSMTEKSPEPKTNWCCPPFYYYTKNDALLITQAINSGCGTDAPGSFIAWLSSKRDVYAYEMPGKRYDIGNLESYERVKKEFNGIC